MGNQQEEGMVTDTDWAWLAGMMNGDGCFSLKLRKRENRWKCDVSITLTQSDPCVIERASDILIRGIGCNPALVEYAPSGAGTSPKLNMRVGRMSHIAAMIEKIVPFMCGAKQAKAKLMLRYVRNRMQYEGMSRRTHTFERDPDAVGAAAEFYALCGVSVPKELSQILRDHPARE